ncbi:Alp7A family actin-like protein, partial [Ligilactobacillus agilis]
LIDTILDFKLSQRNRRQYDTGVTDLYEAIQSKIQGNVSLYQVERTLRSPVEGHYIYEFNKHDQREITDLVKSEIDRFTRRLITNIKSTLKNLDSIDSLFFTGGGANLVNRKLLQQEFKNIVIVENTETANVN